MTTTTLSEPKRKFRLRFTSAYIAAYVGILLIAGLSFTAIFAPQLSPYDPSERVATPFLPPSNDHAFGTNDIGQDILSELIFGARISLLIGVVAGFMTIVIGATVGILGGYYARMGSTLMRITDLILVLPFLPLLIILAAYLGRGLFNTIFIIGILIWAGTARVIRSHVLTTKQRVFVQAADALGATNRHIIVHHILPQVLLLAVSEFVQAVGRAILLEAALSFLGLGDPLQKSWGTILYWAQVRGA